MYLRLDYRIYYREINYSWLYEYSPDGDDFYDTFAQWSDVENPTGGVLGHQYPNPCSKPDNANKPFADTAYTKDSWAPAAGN